MMRVAWRSLPLGWKLYVILVAVFGYQFVGHYLVPRVMYPGWVLGSHYDDSQFDGLGRHWIAHEAGRTEFWYLRGSGVSSRNPGPAVVFAHGSGERIDQRARWLLPYQEAGISVFLCEFRGYGQSTGKPSESALVSDFGRMLTHIRSRDEVDSDRLIFHGRSIGGAIIAALAAIDPPRVLILESTFVDAASASRASLMWPIMIPDRWRSLERLRGYSGATLIVHGHRDWVVPASASKRLGRVIPNSDVVLLDGAGHRVQRQSKEEYWREMESFLSREGCWPR